MVSAHEPDLSAMESALIQRIRLFERTRRRRRRLALGGALSLVIAGALVVSPMVLPGEDAAVAVTPPPLTLTAPTTDTADTFALLRHALQSPSGPVEAVRESTSIGWYARIDGDTMSLEDTPMIPQLIRTQWDRDLSGRVTFQVPGAEDPGEPEPSFEHAVESSSWTLLDEFEFAPGEFDTPLTEIDGDTPEEMRAALAAYGREEDADAARTLDLIAGVLAHWTLTNAQHGALLRMLEDSGQLDAAGTTHDRAGRPVVAFRTRSPGGDFEQLLLTSPETGRIVGLETIRTTAIGNVPAGTVLSYTLWETAP